MIYCLYKFIRFSSWTLHKKSARCALHISLKVLKSWQRLNFSISTLLASRFPCFYFKDVLVTDLIGVYECYPYRKYNFSCRNEKNGVEMKRLNLSFVYDIPQTISCLLHKIIFYSDDFFIKKYVLYFYFNNRKNQSRVMFLQ